MPALVNRLSMIMPEPRLDGVDGKDSTEEVLLKNPQNPLLALLAIFGSGVAVFVLIVETYLRSFPPWDPARGVPTFMVGSFLLIFGLFVGFRSLRSQEWNLTTAGFIHRTLFLNWVIINHDLPFQEIEKVEIAKKQSVIYRKGRYTVSFFLRNRERRVVKVDEFEGKGALMIAKVYSSLKGANIPIQVVEQKRKGLRWW
jgi:hypothetical protein